MFPWLMVPEAGGSVGHLPCSVWAAAAAPTAIPWVTHGPHSRVLENEPFGVKGREQATAGALGLNWRHSGWSWDTQYEGLSNGGKNWGL